MPAATITPVIHKPTGALTEIPGTTVPAGEEWSVDVRVANETAVDVQVRLYIGPDANTANAGARAYDLRVPANDARDLEQRLTLPAGWRLFDRQSGAANAITLTVTGRKRTIA